jgi:histidinol dehydrogenase
MSGRRAVSVRLERLEVEAGEEAPVAAEVRALAPPPPAVEGDVRAIVAAVRERGDAALGELTARFDGADVPPERLRVERGELDAAVRALDPGLRMALETTIDNVRAVARAGVREAVELELPAGQGIELAELPVRRAGAYVPGGRAPYASTVVMCAVTAREAGVDQLAVCAPPGPNGEPHPAILAACGLCGVDEVYRMGGAQAIAALAYGTESVVPVDVIVGPGNAYVQEAKRQLYGQVGLDGIAGPSELVVVASAGADLELAALDLLAQAEHGTGTLVAFVTDSPALLAGLERALSDAGGSPAGEGERVGEGSALPPLALVLAPDAATAVRLGDLVAPEHLQLMGNQVEGLAGEVRTAGAVFVGRDAGTAFGDYVAGSNHVLPTGGAARHASGLSPLTFRRRMARVRLPAGAAATLAPAGAALARAEGFERHAESMARRAGLADATGRT